MRNYLVNSFVLALLFVGCGSDGGNCCGGDNESLDIKGEVLKPQTPTAVINRSILTDTSISQSEFSSDVDGEVYQVPQTNIINVYTITFDCKNSLDNDTFDANENNKSIERCDWNISKPTTCKGESYYSGEFIELNCTDTPDINDTVFVKLTVTDDENQTDDANTTIVY